LAKLREVKPEVTLAFDGVTPVSEASRWQSHIALTQRGEVEAAAETLRELAADETVTLPMRQTAEALLNANRVK
jgi:hypothetical protein